MDPEPPAPYRGSDTLLLSAHWEPMSWVPWQRAMVLCAAGRAEMVETYADRVIRSINAAWSMPAVIRYHRGVRRHVPSVRFSRKNVWLRDGGYCQYCGQTVALRESTFDHVVPRSRGGRTHWENVVIACRACNQRKGNRLPEELGLSLRSRPIRPRNLPSLLRHGLAWRAGMPASWRAYLAH